MSSCSAEAVERRLDDLHRFFKNELSLDCVRDDDATDADWDEGRNARSWSRMDCRRLRLAASCGAGVDVGGLGRIGSL